MSERVPIQQAIEQCDRRLDSLGDPADLKTGGAAYVAHISVKATRQTLIEVMSGEIVTAERQALEAMAEPECYWGDCEHCFERIDDKLEACASCTALHALGIIDNGEQP